jgi:hypothetical protein
VLEPSKYQMTSAPMLAASGAQQPALASGHSYPTIQGLGRSVAHACPGRDGQTCAFQSCDDFFMLRALCKLHQSEGKLYDGACARMASKYIVSRSE